MVRNTKKRKEKRQATIGAISSIRKKLFYSKPATPKGVYNSFRDKKKTVSLNAAELIELSDYKLIRQVGDYKVRIEISEENPFEYVDSATLKIEKRGELLGLEEKRELARFIKLYRNLFFYVYLV